MATLLEKDTCVRGHDVRDKDTTVIIRADNTVVCRKCRVEYTTKVARRKRREAKRAEEAASLNKAISRAIHPSTRPIVTNPNKAVHDEIMALLDANPDFAVPTLVFLSKSIRDLHK
jgi:uncharacterized Zn finger protein (UPF0148 family)